MTKFLTTSDSATFCTRSVETTNQRLAKRHLTTTKRPLTTSTTRTTSKRLLLRGAKLLFQYVIIIILIHHLPFSLNRNEHNEHNRNHNRNQLSSSPTVSNGDHKHHLSFRFFAQALQHTNLSPNVLPAPSFIKSMDSLNVRENTPVNEVIYTLEATIESDFAADVRILYDIEETQLFALEDRRSGRVRVAKQIDREQTGDSVSFLVIATPYLGSRPGAQTRLSITVYILDENDNAPKFERVVVGRQEYDQQALAHRIRLNVSEDTPANSTVVDLIEAVDPDTVSSNPLGALCLDCEPEFRLSPKTANSLNDRLEWSIVLVRPLVHIPRNNLRQLNVIVSDGKFNSSIEFEITIDDVQNRAPHFISSTTCVVQENTPIDRTILTLEAIDGDALALEDGPIVSLASVNSNRSATTGASSGPQQSYAGRQIVYDFVDPTMGGRSSSRQDDFKLHPLTGQLQVANRLDREAYLDRAGVLSLQVRARELTVDAGTVAVGPDDLYESILNKLAPFIDQSDNSTTISEITVILMDINDNSPRWLNATEIEQMSRAPVWHQRLPSDRDTGRNYQLQVRENSLPGSPLTNKNEMFVYDLDSGDNAEFEIRLEDPFNLFDVEPKRVSGFSSVTLKLANTAQGSMGGGGHHAKTRQQQQLQQVLDYENVNERKYIVQLYAQEIRTNERLKSKAQIQINVIDVNDNAPEFKEAAYVANIREDARPGKMVKLVQATDRDEVSKELRYSLHGQSAYLFDVNAQTGLITVAKCADQHHQTPQQPQSAMAARRFVGQTGNQHHYQQQQQQIRPCIDFETQRMHHLMVEASDGELSSKVPFVVYVEDASDNAPTFALPIVDVVIEEGAKRLEPPIRIEATDVDQTSTLSYSIVEGNFEGFFAINNATGELQLTRAIRIPHDDLSAGGLETSSSSIESGAAGGGLSARRQQQFNKMTLIVQASDGEHKTNGTIRIDILDANDNAPEFSRPAYEKEISELAAPGQSVLTVRAFDVDRGNNARVSYRLERGSHGQFDINELSGEISVSQSARPFDASKRDNYTLEVVAYDHGLVSKSSSVIVVIRVVGVGRRAPEFVPQVQRVTISEHALNNNTIIHRMTVSDPLSLNNPQQQQQGQHHQHNLQPVALMFEPGPVEGLDKNGQPVTEIERLESMISVSTNTGDVVVNSNLNHELAAYINLTLYVSYRPVAAFGSPSLYDLIGQNTANLTAGADPSSNAPSQMTAQLAGDEFRPRSVGYLIISVMDNNDHAPYFAAPWTPSQPELSYQMLEELPVGSILTQLVANDADSKISHYEIDPPNEYFELSSPKSGIIVNKKVIDYDTLMRQTYLSPGAHRVAQSASSSTTSMLQPTTGAGAPSAALILQSNTNNGNNVIQFNVIVYDSGVKQLAAKAIVSVEILPINDNDCKFDYQLYEVNLKENALPDTVVTQVRASDLDVGEEHNSISYHLVGDQKDYFNIDARTGVITVSKRGSIGLDREQLAKPIITLTVVGRDNYQLARAGLGDGSGDQSDASNFRQSRGRTSQVPSSANSLGGSGGSRSCSTTLRIHVEDVNDNPPLFAQKIYEVVAYDIDTKDAPLVKLIVHDDDSKHNTIPAPLSVRGGNTNNNGLLSSSTSSSSSNNNNSYRIVSGNFNDSFNITQSGMIYVTRPLNETLAALDRHDASSSSSGTGNPVVELKVEVRQQGFVPPSGASLGAPQTAVVADECLVRVTIMKINRHPPDWRSETNFIPIEENLRPGSLVTQLRCIDRDFEPAKSSPSSSSWVTHYDVQQQLTTAGQQHTQTNGAGRARQSANQLASSAGDNRRPSPIRYWIKENGVNVLETSEFRLDSVSGNLVTRVALDREKRSDYWLLVACEDNGRPESFETITSLYIAVSDVDDNKPEFLIDGQQQQQQRNAVSISREPQGPSSRAANTASSSQHHKPAAIKTITFVVDEQQSKGLQVGELKAIDRDLKPEQPISYCLLEGNEFQEFVLDELTGVLYTNQTLDREKQAYYDLLVKAINDGQSCDDHLAAWSAATSGGQSTNNNSSTAASIVTTTTKKPGNSSPESSVSTMLPDTTSMVKVRVELQDINDNAPVFRRHTFRAGVHHRALSGTLVTQVAAFDPDNEANGTLTYKISEILLYKTNPIASSTFSAGSSKYTSGYSQYQHHNSHHNHQHQTPSAIKLVQLPFRIDQQGNIYTQQLLTQYQLMSWFDVKIEATETTEPWRTATTRLEIYVYETNNQLKIRINLHPRLIESHRHEVETLLSNATKYTAIINRARSYNTNNNMDFAAASNNMANTKSLLDRSGSSQAAAKIPTLDLSQTPSDQYYRQQQVPFSADMSEPVQSSNIHAIFVDQHRLVNPNLVMEKFDLTSAQLLLSAHNFAGQPSELMGPVGQQQQQSSNWQDTNGNNELAPLIDRVALASIQAAEYQASPSGLAGIDWLESPSVLFVCLSSMLFFIGLLICLVGCCCTSRIKDHIIKVAMDKLVKQQALQAKINERVLAATNQAAYASTNGAGSVLGGVSGQQQQHPNNHLMNGAGHDFMLAQGAGFMSSFDATKGCLNNNYENMSILQRAMEAGEFFDPNYTTLNNNNNNTMTTPAGHLNLGAHYYDASELDNQQEDDNGTGLDANNADKQYQMMNGAGAMDNSVVSLSLEEEYDDDDDEDGDRDMNDGSGNNYDMTTNANSGDLSNGHDTQQKLAKETKLYTNGLNGMVSSHHSRLRQQIPNNKYSHDT